MELNGFPHVIRNRNVSGKCSEVTLCSLLCDTSNKLTNNKLTDNKLTNNKLTNNKLTNNK